MKRFCLVLVLVSAGFTQDAHNGPVAPTQENGHYLLFFVSAERYKGAPEEVRQAYVTGLMDGRLNPNRFGNNKKTLAATTTLRNCVMHKTITQITAIVDKYVASHPEDWDKPASVAVDDAFANICEIPWS